MLYQIGYLLCQKQIISCSPIKITLFALSQKGKEKQQTVTRDRTISHCNLSTSNIKSYYIKEMTTFRDVPILTWVNGKTKGLTREASFPVCNLSPFLQTLSLFEDFGTNVLNKRSTSLDTFWVPGHMNCKRHDHTLFGQDLSGFCHKEDKNTSCQLESWWSKVLNTLAWSQL